MSTRTVLSAVMRGLDPRIHDEKPLGTSVLQSLPHRLMDCRVKGGNDVHSFTVIPGRCEAADPESRRRHCSRFLIPGPALAGRPGMTVRAA